MPVGNHNMSKRPLDAVQAQPAGDGRIFIHIGVVVITDKSEMSRLPKDQPDNGGKKETNPEDQPAITQTSRMTG